MAIQTNTQQKIQDNELVLISGSHLFNVNGKLESISWIENPALLYKYLKRLYSYLQKRLPTDILDRSFFEFITISKLLRESHLNDRSYNNNLFVYYLLSIIDYNACKYDFDIPQSVLNNFLRISGVENVVDFELISQTQQFLLKSNILGTEIVSHENYILAKIDQIVQYVKNILPGLTTRIDQLRDKAYELVRKHVIPIEDPSLGCIIIVLTLFPFYMHLKALQGLMVLFFQHDFELNPEIMKRKISDYEAILRKRKLP